MQHKQKCNKLNVILSKEGYLLSLFSIFVSVTEYGVALDIDNFNGLVGNNISGTSDLAPLDQQAQMVLDLFPQAKTVGLLYCSSEANSLYQVEVVEKYLTSKNLKVNRYAFDDSNSVDAVVKQACDEIDVLYIPTDNTCASNGALSLFVNGQTGKARGIIAELFDEGTFAEIGAYYGGGEDFEPVVTGYGAIGGELVYVFAQDFSNRKGAVTPAHAEKICALLDKADKADAPVIGVFDSAGAVVVDGVRSSLTCAGRYGTWTNSPRQPPTVRIWCSSVKYSSLQTNVPAK